MRIPFIDLLTQARALRKPVLKAVSEVYDSQQFVLKTRVAELEERLARLAGVRHGVGVASGSDALYLSLLALGVGPGDEVITTPFTFFATAGAISRTGARPVFADIDPDTFNLDPVKMEAAITRRTKAVIPVHLFGLCADMPRILKTARRRRLAVVEDAAQSIGAAAGGRPAGSFGDTACFSFYPTKNLGGAGDGGLVTTDSGKLAGRIRLLRDHGQVRKYVHGKVGFNSRLDEIQAAVLLVKLGHLKQWNAARRAHARAYDRELAGLPVKTPFVPAGYGHVYHLYSVLAPRRKALLAHLAKKGIGAAVYYPLPLHLQPCYRSLGYRRGDLPVAEAVSRQILSLPMYPEMPVSHRRAVTRAIREFYLS